MAARAAENAKLAALVLDLAEAQGALQLYTLLSEIAAFAGGKLFTSAELCAHASLPENIRMRSAIERACGEVSARKLGKLFARIERVPLAHMVIVSRGSELDGVVWALKHIPATQAQAEASMLDSLPPTLGE